MPPSNGLRLRVSASCGLAAGWRMRQPSLNALNIIYCAMNVVEIYRWLLQ